jgi:hypothetical protein
MASCAYVLTLGRRHFEYAPSTYRTCITPTQAKELFGSTVKPKPLGCGVFACVFQHADPTKVVKITRDESDVAGLLQAQGLATAPKVYAQHKLAGQPRWTTTRARTHSTQVWPEHPEAFALVLEKLHVMTGAEKGRWNRRIRRWLRLREQDQEKREMIAAGGGRTTPTHGTYKHYKSPTKVELARRACPAGPKAEAVKCEARLLELGKIIVDLRTVGVEWTDVHAGNIGADKNGHWKALDLGASTTTLDQDVPILEGRQRRRKRA